MILGRDRHPASACFDEIDEAVRQLRGRDDVVFNAHMAGVSGLPKVPKDAIIYNLEGVGNPGSPFCVTPFAFPDHEVWDFSARNCERWKAGGRNDVKHVPLGWHPSLKRLERAKSDNGRVLFFGLVNDRRSCVLQAVAATGVAVDLVKPWTYGEPLYQQLAQCRAVLNWRYYDDGPYPALRALLCCANLVPVWSEPCDDKPVWADGMAIPPLVLPS